MPTYDWKCPEGHVTTAIVRWDERDNPVPCQACGAPTERQFPAPHVPVDGVYSYAENIGSAAAFERKQAKMRGEIPLDAE